MIIASPAKTSVALSIAGSDSSAGAGIQADLKTFSALGVYGATVITAITAQNTQAVSAVHPIPASMITAQLDAVFSDLNIGAVKTGMLGPKKTVLAVTSALRKWAAGKPIVVDPVMISTSGSVLLDEDAQSLVVQQLIPMAALITPNLFEAAALLQTEPAQTLKDAYAQAEELMKLGPRAVLLKGGHGGGAQSIDVFFDGMAHHTFSAPRLQTRNTHGTGCTLASAITAFLIKGHPLTDAIAEAKAYLQQTLENADIFHIGEGAGPVCHFPDLTNAS